MNDYYDPDPAASRAHVIRVEQALAALLCLATATAAVALIVGCAAWLWLNTMISSLPLGR